MKKVMVLEDESSIRSFIVINLRRAGYDVIEAETGEEEPQEKQKRTPDTRGAPWTPPGRGLTAFEVCRRIRATNTKIGIIMLTARSQEMDKVTGLMTGADDYVTKPFSPAELTARVDALFRRAGGEEPAQTGEIRQDPFLLNTRNRTLEKNGQRIKLTQVEYSIMKVFMENPGQGPLPGGDPGYGLGSGLFRRAEDRGCEHPPPAAEDRGQRAESHVHHHGVGIRIQVGVLSGSGRCPGPRGRAGRWPVQAFWRKPKPWRKVEFTPPRKLKRVPSRAAGWGATCRIPRISPRCGDTDTSGGSEKIGRPVMPT